MIKCLLFIIAIMGHNSSQLLFNCPSCLKKSLAFERTETGEVLSGSPKKPRRDWSLALDFFPQYD